MISHSLNPNLLFSNAVAALNNGNELLKDATWCFVHQIAFNLITSSKEEVIPALCYFATRKVISFLSKEALLLISKESEESPSWNLIKYSALPFIIATISAKYLVTQATKTLHTEDPKSPLSFSYILTLEWSRRFGAAF